MGSEGKVLKYGIIGVGMMGCEHLYNLAALPGTMVVAVADPHPGSREAALAATAGLQSVVPSLPLTVRAQRIQSLKSSSHRGIGTLQLFSNFVTHVCVYIFEIHY